MSKKVLLELDEREILVLLKGAQVANSVVLGEKPTPFYGFNDKRYELYIRVIDKLRDALMEARDLKP